MSRRRNRRPVVPNAGPGLDQFKAEVMRRQGFAADPARPDAVKYEVARTLGVPLQSGNNGQLTTEQAGKVGGRIGGTMVQMIRMAQEQLIKK